MRAASRTRFIFASAKFGLSLMSKSGEVIDGDPREIRENTDVWTFERDTTSRDPNWKLVATEASA